MPAFVYLFGVLRSEQNFSVEVREAMSVLAEVDAQKDELVSDD